jgi:hypothetical protein
VFRWASHLRERELRFVGSVLLTLVIIALYLDTGLRRTEEGGTGWREVDLEALQRRIETGELRDREADWYHPATPEEAAGGGLE